MNSYRLINYFPNTQNFCSISMKNLHIEDPYRYKIAMESDADCMTIKNNELYYYFYVSSKILNQKSYNKIIKSFDNVIKNNTCTIDIPIIISINNNIHNYYWLNEETKIKMENIIKNEFEILHSINLYHVLKKN